MNIRKGKVYKKTCMRRLFLHASWALSSRLLMRSLRYDHTIRQELYMLPEGFSCTISVMPAGPSVLMKLGENSSVRLNPVGEDEDADLVVTIHDLSTALRLASCSLSMSEAVSRHGVSFYGDQHLGCAVMRIIERLCMITLPRKLAAGCVKRYRPPERSRRLKLKIWTTVMVHRT